MRFLVGLGMSPAARRTGERVCYRLSASTMRRAHRDALFTQKLEPIAPVEPA